MNEQQLLDQITARAAELDWNAFETYWLKAVSDFYSPQGLSRTAIKDTAGYKLGQTLGSDLAVKSGHAKRSSEFILTRTDDPPAKITGEHLIALGSSNAANCGAKKQWFTVDLYRTVAGTHVAHVKYRGGSGLREEPIDCVYTGKTPAALMQRLDAVDTEDDFVTGWPHATGDFVARHATVCDYADKEYRDVLEKCRAVLAPDEPETIL